MSDLRQAVLAFFKDHDQDGIRAGYGPNMFAPIDLLYEHVDHPAPATLEMCERLADEGILIRDDEPTTHDGPPVPHFRTKGSDE
jgi:hypothetical protein